MKVRIANRTRSLARFGSGRLPPARLRRAAEAALRAAGFPPRSELSLLFVDDRRMTRLNSEHMGRTGTTDVIAFPFIEPGEEFPEADGDMQLLVGEVIISLDAAERQAAEYSHSPERELVELLVHGILHLRQYDHADAARKRIMARESERILKLLGDEVAFP